MRTRYILRNIVLGITFFISGFVLADNIVLLDAGGMQVKWSKALNLNLADSDKIAIRIVSQKECRVYFVFKKW